MFFASGNASWDVRLAARAVFGLGGTACLSGPQVQKVYAGILIKGGVLKKFFEAGDKLFFRPAQGESFFQRRLVLHQVDAQGRYGHPIPGTAGIFAQLHISGHFEVGHVPVYLLRRCSAAPGDFTAFKRHKRHALEVLVEQQQYLAPQLVFNNTHKC